MVHGAMVESLSRFSRLVCLIVVLLSLIPDAKAQDRIGEQEADTVWSEVLHLLFSQEWDWRKKAYGPSWTTLPDVSAEAQRERASRTYEFLESLSQIDRSHLSWSDQVSAHLFEVQLRDRLKAYEFGAYQIPVHTHGGFHRQLALIPYRRQFRTEADVQKYMGVLREIPRYVEQHIENMRLGLERGMTQPAIVIRSIQKDVSALAVNQPEASPFYVPFTSLPIDLSNRRQRKLRKEARDVVGEVGEAFRTFGVFLQEYERRTRTDIAATGLPNGKAYYNYQIRRFTTLEVSADVLHRIGLREVDRIRSEMKTIMDSVGFEGPVQDFIDSLRTDPRFTPASAEDQIGRALCRERV